MLNKLLQRRPETPAGEVSGEDCAGSPPRRRSTPGDRPQLLLQAEALLVRAAFNEAVGCYEEFLQFSPDHAIARNNLGVAHLKLGHYQQAEAQFRLALELEPDYADAHSNLGNVLRLRGKYTKAETALRRVLKLNPTHVAAKVNLGLTLMFLGRLGDARDCFEKVLRITPRNAEALLGMGRLAATEGRFDDAETTIKRALEGDAEKSGAWAALIGLRKMTPADLPQLEILESLAAKAVDPTDEAGLRFAIGKYCDDIGHFARAFDSFKRANELQKLVADVYERDARTAFVDDLTRVYTRESLSRARSGGSNSEKPVLVVGMMRSGTSLVEQIIASHPLAAGAGELDFWNTAVRKHAAAVRPDALTEPLNNKLADAYLRALAANAPKALRVVDKSTINSDCLGLINSVFPKARIIYLRRDPIDACLSCYFQQFSAGLNFTMDLSDLAHYYREHHRLIAHWRAVLPAGTLLEVPYEELTADQEKWIRKIVDFLGLEWDPRCLDFHSTRRPVLTASYWQVRQRIYGNSVGRWRNYRKYITPLLGLAELKP
jgi:tetratricopeptide (TPR) repeat protein